MNIENHISSIARQFIGLEELPNNSGFKDHEKIRQLTGMHPQEFMETIGWEKGFAWCSFFVEAVWKYAYTIYDSGFPVKYNSLFSGSVAQTEVNFQASNDFMTSNTPKIGSIVIWLKTDKNGNFTKFGHTGILERFDNDHLYTIEGNTNIAGEREGKLVLPKKRNFSFEIKPNSLVLKSFIHPIEV